ncbi:MAG: amidase [Pseudomonadota bacterium]
MTSRTDPLGAFCPFVEVRIEGAPSGPLAGLTFAAKDIFDVAGFRTGAGNPDWLATHGPAGAHSFAVQALLEAGASLIGKTLTDELAYGMTGRNFHYGAPINPAAPDRITGGSSSGSASAVAGEAADVALGSDTGGSVRIPASYCGIYGMRPTHGRIPLDGVVALAPSFDTVGWFARHAALLERAGRVLLRATGAPAKFTRLLAADDLFAAADPGVADALGAVVEEAARVVGRPAGVTVCATSLDAWAREFRTILAGQAWASDGAWIERVRPRFGPDVQGRFEAASKVSEAAFATARQLQDEVARRMESLLAGGAVMVLPTAPGPAPAREASLESLTQARYVTHRFTCLAPLAALPQVSIPAASVAGGPVGISFMAARGADEMLLALASALSD